MKDKENFLDSLIEIFKTGDLSRRNFLKIATASGITIASAENVMAGQHHNGWNCLTCHSQAPPSPLFTPDPITEKLIKRAKILGIELVWDRGSPCQNAHKGQGG